LGLPVSPPDIEYSGKSNIAPALQFYGDGTLDRVPVGMQRDLTRWAQATDLGKLPILHPKRGLSPRGLER
jgi:hypothetical protein